MFCDRCQREVAAMKSPQTGALHCSQCGAEKKSTVSVNNHSIAQTAHALLKRWEESREKDQPQETSAEVVQTPSAGQVIRKASEQIRQNPQDFSETELELPALPELNTFAETEILADLPDFSWDESAWQTQAAASPPASASPAEQKVSRPQSEPAAIEKRPALSTDHSSWNSPEKTLSASLREHSAVSHLNIQPADTAPPKKPPAQLVRNESMPAPVAQAKPVEPAKPRETASEQKNSFPNPPDFASLLNQKQGISSETRETSMKQSAAQPQFTSESHPSGTLERSYTASELEKSFDIGKPEKSFDASEAQTLPTQGQLKFGRTAQKLTDLENLQSFAPTTRKQRNWSAGIGQLLAFTGALAMTGGAAIVIGNRFGSLEMAETTGWLAVAGGHLLFLLGIYTHLTSRVEQIWHDLHGKSEDLQRLIQQQQHMQQTYFNQLRPQSAPLSREQGAGSTATFQRSDFSSKSPALK